jgi:glycine/D-amino acid oxidase-like deaminating enzyme
MRKIAIVGGGQSGLQPALGLLKNHYEVTIVSDRTAEQIFNGRVTSSQFMFHDSLQNERDLAINFWEKECPRTEGIAFTFLVKTELLQQQPVLTTGADSRSLLTLAAAWAFN